MDKLPSFHRLRLARLPGCDLVRQKNSAELQAGKTIELGRYCGISLSAVVAFLAHYHAERNHQALGNRLIDPGEEVGRTTGEVAFRERLGGILRYYYRKAA
jgi:hypothetical protein